MDSGNVWISRVAAAQRRFAALLAVPVAFAVLALALYPVAIWANDNVHLSAGSPLGSEALNRAVRYAAIFAPLGICASASLLLWERRARLRAALSRGEAALVGLLIGLVAFAAVILISLLAGNLRVEQPVGGIGLATVAGVVAGGLLLAFQSGIEEWFFRGWLLPLIAADWGVWIALVVTSVLFAAAHALGEIPSPAAAANLLLAGLLFGLLALRTGRLSAAFAAHWVWNWLEQSVVGLTPNPGVDPLGTLVDLKLVGSSLAGAGPDELNGALAVTGVFAALVLLLMLLPGARVRAP